MESTLTERTETTVRLPARLHQSLVAEANQRGISLNALITLKLEGTIPAGKQS